MNEISLTPSLVKAITPTLKKQNVDEKEILNDLNQRLEYYLSRVKDEEENNKQLKSEIDFTIKSWGVKIGNVINNSGSELQNCLSTIDYFSTEVARSIAKNQKLEYKIDHLKHNLDNETRALESESTKIDKLKVILENSLDELDYLKNSLDATQKSLEENIEKNSQLNKDLDVLINRREEFNSKNIILRNLNQTLEEHIPFLNAIQEKEMEEMRRLFEDRKIDPLKFYRDELKRVIEEIRNDFILLSDIDSREIKAWYEVKTNEMKIFSQKFEGSELPQIIKSKVSLKQEFKNNNEELIELNEKQHKLLNLVFLKEKEFDTLQTLNIEKLAKQDLKIMKKRKQIEDYLEDYRYIIHNKGTTEYEINTLKRLLDSTNMADESKKQNKVIK
jgi:hypothetical protein